MPLYERYHANNNILDPLPDFKTVIQGCSVVGGDGEEGGGVRGVFKEVRGSQKTFNI